MADDLSTAFDLPKHIMLKRSEDIRDVLSNGRKSTGQHINLFLLPAEERKFAVIVPKRIGNAVKRNRMKRVSREIYRTHPEWFSNLKTIIFVKRFHDNCGELEREIKRLVLQP